ncbi:MAG TPA: hypothetical protein VM841_12470 [Actinomycetota bacterium]|nr:hypothetical protein [Actinomycetota bacterium]
MRRIVTVSAVLLLAATLDPALSHTASVRIEQRIRPLLVDGSTRLAVSGSPCRSGRLIEPLPAIAGRYEVECFDPVGRFNLSLEVDDRGEMRAEGWFLIGGLCCPESIGPFSPAVGGGRYRFSDPWDLRLRGLWAGPGSASMPSGGDR